MLQGSSFDGSWGKKIRCHLFVFLQSSCFLSQDAVCPWSQCIISPFLVEVKNSKSKFYMNFHSNVCSLNKKTSEREWKNIEVFEMGFCICIIRNNIYRFRISWNNTLENRLQTETAECWPQNNKCKIDILFYVIDVRPWPHHLNQVFGLWFHWNCIYSVNDRIHQCSW